MTTIDTILDALADALVEKIAARLPPGGQQQTYTVAQLAERYGMSKASIAPPGAGGGVRRDDQRRAAHPSGHGRRCGRLRCRPHRPGP